jgi:predicted GNAT family acetyltransferase
MVTVLDDPAKSRYELFVDGALAGFAAYELGDDRITVFHVEIDQRWGGQGLGRQLVDGMLADIRSRGLALLPVCPFTRRVVAENQADYLDLVPANARDQFGLPH